MLGHERRVVQGVVGVSVDTFWVFRPNSVSFFPAAMLEFSLVRASGGIGRRAGFRFQCLRTWGFKSPLAYRAENGLWFGKYPPGQGLFHILLQYMSPCGAHMSPRRTIRKGPDSHGRFVDHFRSPC